MSTTSPFPVVTEGAECGDGAVLGPRRKCRERPRNPSQECGDRADFWRAWSGRGVLIQKVQAPSPARVGLYAQEHFKRHQGPDGSLPRRRPRPAAAAKRWISSRGLQRFLLRLLATGPLYRLTDGPDLRLHPRYGTLHAARRRQSDPYWRQRYRSNRPKVERSLAHLMRRKHGWRRAFMRGCGHDFALLAAGVNLARLAVLQSRADSTVASPRQVSDAAHTAHFPRKPSSTARSSPIGAPQPSLLT
jgi:hypothetical protein